MECRICHGCFEPEAFYSCDCCGREACANCTDWSFSFGEQLCMQCISTGDEEYIPDYEYDMITNDIEDVYNNDFIFVEGDDL